MPEETPPIIGSYKARPVACRDYDPRAAAVAGQIAVLIAKHLPKLRAEHVGSTSVPGCAGKGIVDLMIACRDQKEPAAVKELLERLGFQSQGGPDPFPEDRPMRVGSLACDGEVFLLHVHVIPAGSPEVDQLRFFRACLRADPDLVKAYVARKRKIIDGGVTDSREYCSKKAEFIKDVLA